MCEQRLFWLAQQLKAPVDQRPQGLLARQRGPITVSGKLYQLNNEMPALLNNKDVSDQDIVDIIQFTQNAFAKEVKRISVDDVKKQRLNKPVGSGIYNEKLLLETDFEK